MTNEVSNEGLPDEYQWFSDQIAGHHPSVIKNGKREIGLLKIPGTKEILKPKQDASRGEKEVAIYQILSSSSSTSSGTSTSSEDELRNGAHLKDIEKLRMLTAEYHGIRKLFVDGEDRDFLILEDVISDYHRPAILDLKMGQLTYDPLAKPEKIEKERIKYPPQAVMGCRILGYRIHRSDKVEVRDKDWGKSFDETTIQDGLREFFSARNDGNLKEVLNDALRKLEIIKEFFETQKSFLFFASSLLFVFEADRDRPINLKIFMIDFSHAFSSNGLRDEGYLFGIQNLEKFLNQLLNEL